VAPGDLYFGDLVFFDTGGKGVSHVGIYVGFDEFVHVSSTDGIIISNLTDKYYSKRFLSARRVME
jgi:cell wall-associated NlpC family hydrolase